MPPLYSKGVRDLLAKKKKEHETSLPRSLHRGIHLQENADTVAAFKSTAKNPRNDHCELLVHHQKINESLQDLYARTAALHKDDATMEERIEESWRQFERIGGKRPTNIRTKEKGSCLCANRTAVPYAQRLEQVSEEKKNLRSRAEVEKATRGEIVDYSDGSALHALKDKRVRMFQKRQLQRAHTLRRVGDPNPLHQSGKFDSATGMLKVFNKTIRKVKREVAQDERVALVKERRKGQLSQWDVSEYNINSSTGGTSSQSKDWNFGSHRQKKRRRME